MSAGVKINDLGGNAVDGAELRRLGAVRPEQTGKALLHLLCGGFGIGHGQDASSGDAPAAEHISQAGHQHRGLAAAGHGQEQHRPVHGVDCFRLLRIEPQGVFLVKFRSFHAALPPVRSLMDGHPKDDRNILF